MAFPKSDHLSNVQIADYVDGLLSPAERQQVERHLQSCAVCRAEVHSRRILHRRIRYQRLRRRSRIRLPETGPLHA